MKVLSLDPDSHIGALLAGGAFNPTPHIAIVPARRAGDALSMLSADPDIAAALVDLRIALRDQASMLRELRRAAPALPIIIVGSAVSTAEARESMLQGARGIILLSMSREAMLRSLDIVASGGIFLPPGVFDAAAVLSAPRASPGEADTLTPRQREVLKLLAQGRATREISRSLGLSEGTVKNHLSAIFRLLRVRNRVQAVLRAQNL